MRDVYAATFRLGPVERPDGPVLDAAAETALDWMSEKYPGTPPAAEVAAGRLEVGRDEAEWSTDGVEGDPRRLWHLLWRQHSQDDPGLVWRTLIHLAQDRHESRFTLRLAIESESLRISPARYEVGRPNVVRQVAERVGAHVDGRNLSPAPERVLSDHVRRLVDLLLDPDRRLPVIVVTPSIDTGRPVVDEGRMADRLFGLAHVVAIGPASATYELTAQLRPELSVFQGAVRLYWPGLNLDARPYDHPLWLPDRLAEMEAERRPLTQRLERLLGGIAVLRVPVDPLVRELREADDAVAQRRMDELREALEAERRLGHGPDDTWLASFEGTLQDLGQARAQMTQLNAFTDQLQRRVESLEEDNDRLLRNLADYPAASEVGADDTADGLLQAPLRSVLEAVERATRECPSLIFLPDARESAAASRYRQPDKVYTALLALGDVARRQAAGELGQGIHVALDEAGFGKVYRDGVSEEAVVKHPGEYQRQYKGSLCVLGPHLALGRGTTAENVLRIHWFPDDEERKLVIAHVGGHLHDRTT